jgi:hypothetical protein
MLAVLHAGAAMQVIKQQMSGDRIGAELGREWDDVISTMTLRTTVVVVANTRMGESEAQPPHVVAHSEGRSAGVRWSPQPGALREQRQGDVIWWLGRRRFHV